MPIISFPKTSISNSYSNSITINTGSHIYYFDHIYRATDNHEYLYKYFNNIISNQYNINIYPAARHTASNHTTYGRTQRKWEILMYFKILDASGVDSAYGLVDYPSGASQNISLYKLNNSYYLLKFPITEEGKYLVKVIANDAKGNIGDFKTDYTFFDKPVIDDVSYSVNAPKVYLNVSARDTSGIKRILVKICEKNYMLSPLKVDKKKR